MGQVKPVWEAPVRTHLLNDGFLLSHLGNEFIILTVNTHAPESLEEEGVVARRIAVSSSDDPSGALAERYLGGAASAVYLIRPDQHVAARWNSYDEAEMRAALRKACGRK